MKDSFGVGKIRAVRYIFLLGFPLNLMKMLLYLTVTLSGHWTWKKWCLTTAIYLLSDVVGILLEKRLIRKHPLYYMALLKQELESKFTRLQAYVDEDEKTTWNLDEQGELILPHKVVEGGEPHFREQAISRIHRPGATQPPVELIRLTPGDPYPAGAGTSALEE